MSRGLAAFVALQVGWFASVGGGARDLPWLGPAVVAVFVAIHLVGTRERPRELATVVAFGLAGSAVDSLWSATGLLAFHGAAGALVCPPWIAALWLHFATTLRGPLAPLAARPLLAAALAAVGAPLSYLAGTRLGAVALHPDTWPSLVAVALAWAVLLPLGLRLANHATPPAGPSRRHLRRRPVPALVAVPLRQRAAGRSR